MNIPSETVQAAQRLLAEREAVGLAKYGTTVDRADLQAGDWVQHAIEEASDLLLYLIRLQKMIPRTPDSDLPTLSSLAGSCPGLVSLEDQADAERAAYLARWAKAPWNATHLCETVNGSCYWTRGKPRVMAGGYWTGAEFFLADETVRLGRFGCEPRPTLEGGQGVEG